MKNKLLYIISLLFILGHLSLNAVAENLNPRINLIFRYDDYTLKPKINNDSLLNVFKKNNIPLCVGIVPVDKDGKLINELNTEQLNNFKSRIDRKEIEITLHGYNHASTVPNKFISILNKKYNSEFAFLNYEKQYERLSIAKFKLDSLLGINIQTFVPPWNMYDNNTLKALENLKFKIISADINGPSDNKNIKYIPDTQEDFDDFVGIINKYKNKNVTIVVLFHPYSFKGCCPEYPNKYSERISFYQLDTILKWINKQNNIDVYTFSTINKKEDFDETRFKLNSTKTNLLVRVLQNLNLFEDGVYFSYQYLQNIKILLGIFNILFHLLCFWLFYMFAKMMAKVLRPNKIIIIIFSIVFVIMVLSFLVWYYNSPVWLIMFIFLVMSSIAIFLGLYQKHELFLNKTEN
jgi:hypothetical protein